MLFTIHPDDIKIILMIGQHIQQLMKAEYNNRHFIDITANGASLAKQIKLTVLNTTEGKALFKSQSIQRVQADWTQ